MKILIDISNYNYHWIRNAYQIPDDIKTQIAESIIYGKIIDFYDSPIHIQYPDNE